MQNEIMKEQQFQFRTENLSFKDKTCHGSETAIFNWGCNKNNNN